jgi:perosamine synthetase
LVYKITEPDIGEEEEKEVITVLRSGQLGGRGDEVGKFEKAFAKRMGSKNGVATPNGTSALHLALMALGIGKEDEVIVPDLTFAATINAVIYTGAAPVLIDVNKDYWGMEAEAVEKAITPKTKAILPVHLYGHPCNMMEIMNVAEDNNLVVVEDCAEAHGAEVARQTVGTFGSVGCFSFYGNKLMTTGEGGMCITDDDRLADRMRYLADQCMTRERPYWHGEVGRNYLMNAMSAAVGLVQVKRLNELIEKKRRIAKIYAEEFEDTDVHVVREESWAKDVYWLNCITLYDEWTRDKLHELLKRYGIETRKLFYPLHVMPPYAVAGRGKEFPISDEVSSRGLCLPSSTKLVEKDVRKIAGAIKDVLVKLERTR